MSNVEEVMLTAGAMNHHDIYELIKPLMKLQKLEVELKGGWDNVYASATGVREFVEGFEIVAGRTLDARDLTWGANEQSVTIVKNEEDEM